MRKGGGCSSGGDVERVTGDQPLDGGAIAVGGNRLAIDQANELISHALRLVVHEDDLGLVKVRQLGDSVDQPPRNRRIVVRSAPPETFFEGCEGRGTSITCVTRRRRRASCSPPCQSIGKSMAL